MRSKRTAALERGIEAYLDGTWYRRRESERDADTCEHGKPMAETCEECIRSYFRAVLGGLNVDDPGAAR